MPIYDDAWYEEWKRGMEEHGNVILALGIRLTDVDSERAILEMPMSRNVRQGTGVFAAGALMQLADVGATSLIQHASGSTRENPQPFPLSVQISVNLLRNTDHGKAISESRFAQRGRTLTVVESRVRDADGRLLCIVTSTHVAVPRAAEGR